MTTTRSASRTRGTGVSRAAVNGHTYAHASTGSRQVPLRSHTAEALSTYFANLNGHRPGRLYELVLREVEEPLFRAVMNYAEGNQCRAAAILGINRGTLRKKLREYGLAD